MSNAKDILHEDDEFNEEQLMKYLQGNLSGDDLHNIEKQMADSDFLNDAVEGLESFKNKKQLQSYVNDLNHQLQRQTEANKQRKIKRKFKDDSSMTAIYVVIIFLLCIIGFYMVRKYLDNKKVQTPTTSQINTKYDLRSTNYPKGSLWDDLNTKNFLL
ncbi:hypothetical protein ACI6Q2_20745 [Chitinophagaceae bacterium LWZ2-11]